MLNFVFSSLYNLTTLQAVTPLYQNQVSVIAGKKRTSLGYEYENSDRMNVCLVYLVL